jgi:hypothetical protein
LDALEANLRETAAVDRTRAEGTRTAAHPSGARA